MKFKDFCIKYKWWLLIGGLLTLQLGIGIIGIIFGIIGFKNSPKETSGKKQKKKSLVEKYFDNLGRDWGKLKDAGNVGIISMGLVECPECGTIRESNEICEKCGFNFTEHATKIHKKNKKNKELIEIHNSKITKQVLFGGGHKEVKEKVDGCLGLTNTKLIFKNKSGDEFNILLSKIKKIDRIADELTITYKATTRIKSLVFSFDGFTSFGKSEECLEFYNQLNAILD